MSVNIRHGDCLEVLRTLPADSVDAVVTDPPAAIGFMGKSWDKDKGGRQQWVAWLAEIMTETRRAMKPGAYALVWALPRTSHWTGCAIEDGGLLIQDRISHIFSTGFPKSKTHLKPACEDWWLAFKKGKRALNIEACRVGTDESTSRPPGRARPCGAFSNSTLHCREQPSVSSPAGRWPANVTHDGSAEVVGLFPASSGGGPIHNRAAPKHNGVYGGFQGEQERWAGYGDTGCAARFFYAAKASREDRNEGCKHIGKRALNWSAGTQSPGTFQGEGTDRSANNHHPTCKSTELMRWLCRLITPPGGIILDPFMGSGSTGKAAVIEGFGFIGIEREAEYVEIARARIAHAQGPLFAEFAS